MTKHKVVVFDLDDTLYKEVDFLHSAFREIAYLLEQQYGLKGVFTEMLMLWSEQKNVFATVIARHNLPVTADELLSMYRNHIPQLSISMETRNMLSHLSKTCPLGIITDGRSQTQRSKLKALQLTAYFKEDIILISDETGFTKPSPEPFQMVMKFYPNALYYYIGDNTDKDFIAPNALGWQTICLLDDGRNIHSQRFDIPKEKLPYRRISKLSELQELIMPYDRIQKGRTCC